jgi:hypothetical protein
VTAKQKQQKKRPYYGGGMPKGHKTQKVLEREAEREVMRQMVMAAMRPMIEAQVANAMGVKYLVFRDKNGTFKPVTDVKSKLAQEGEELEVWEKFPNVQAFSDLMDRTFDKPSQSMALDVTIGSRADRIIAARQRADGKR